MSTPVTLEVEDDPRSNYIGHRATYREGLRFRHRVCPGRTINIEDDALANKLLRHSDVYVRGGAKKAAEMNTSKAKDVDAEADPLQDARDAIATMNKGRARNHARRISAWIWTSASRSIRCVRRRPDCSMVRPGINPEPRRTPRQFRADTGGYDSSVLLVGRYRCPLSERGGNGSGDSRQADPETRMNRMSFSGIVAQTAGRLVRHPVRRATRRRWHVLRFKAHRVMFSTSTNRDGGRRPIAGELHPDDRTLTLDSHRTRITLYIEFFRTPAEAMEEDEDRPEIHPIHHDGLLQWAFHLAYSVPDADIVQPRRAKRAEEFIHHVRAPTDPGSSSLARMPTSRTATAATSENRHGDKQRP